MPTDLTPGARVGRFVVGKHLGEGGMGTVVEARDPELGRSVALKLLRAEGGDTMRLLREAQALATISHPNVVAVYELGTHDGEVFLAMELVLGVSLDHHLAERRRPWSEVLALFVQAGRGLAAVHERGMVHRDVKPANVLVDRNGRVRVGDFGLARRDTGPVSGARTPSPTSEDDPANLEATPSNVTVTHGESLPVERGATMLGTPLTRTGAVLGTPRYMAPEQHAGARATHHADQFAFCVALWEALFGAHPFAGASDSAFELRTAVQAGDVQRPPERRDVPRWLEDVLVRGLSAEPAARWPSMNALLQELDRGPRRSWRPWLGAGAAAGVVALGAAMILTRGGGTHESDGCDALGAQMEAHWNPGVRASLVERLGNAPYAAEDVASFERFAERWPAMRIAACRDATKPESRARAAWVSGCLDQALGELDAAVGAKPWISQGWGHIRPVLPSLGSCERGKPPPVPTLRSLGSRRGWNIAALSPDGRHVATVEGGALRIFGDDGDRSVALPASIKNGMLRRWRRDGTIQIAHDDRMHTVDPSSGGLVSTFDAPPDTWIQSPDDSLALAVSATEWTLVDLATGIRTRLEVPPEPVSPIQATWSPDGRRIAAVVNARHGDRRHTILRMIDVPARRAHDQPLRLEHGVSRRVVSAWLDDSHLLINGRVRPDQGEAIWRATLDVDGKVVDWELRMSTPPATSYLASAVRGGRSLAELISVSGRIVRIRGGAEEVISDTVDVTGRGPIASTNDGRIAVTTAKGVSLVTIATGNSLEVPAMSGAGVAVDARGRFLSVHDGHVRATDGSGTSVLPIAAGRDDVVRCSVGGRACALVTLPNDGGELRLLQGATLGAPVILPSYVRDIALSPDGTRVAVLGSETSIDIIDVKTSQSEAWPVPKLCPQGFTHAGAWAPSGRELWVVLTCNDDSRVLRYAAGRAPEVVFTAPDIAAIATDLDGNLYAMVRRYETHMTLLEGL